MPHPPGESRSDHLLLARVDFSPPRRKGKPPPSPPIDLGRRIQHGADLRVMFARLEAEGQSAPSPAGTKPHLVFRVPTTKPGVLKNLAGKLSKAGVSVVATDSDGHIVAFKDDASLSALITMSDDFAAGPKPGVRSTTADVFDFIDVANMRRLTPRDRIGVRLAAEIGLGGEWTDPDALYVVDVELWHDGTPATQALIAEVTTAINSEGRSEERVRDTFTTTTLCLMKISVYGHTLRLLLDMAAVAEIELPPVVSFNPPDFALSTKRDFATPPKPPSDGPSLCVIDTGIAPRHPLIESNVGGYDSVLTATQSGADENGHGTMVAAVAIFGDVRRAYIQDSFASDITLYSARVLNHLNEFDDEKLIINQMQQAIVRFSISPYNCRVFNISIGMNSPHFINNTKQGAWAECLDILSRKHKVLVVVSAGNHRQGLGLRAKQAAEIIDLFPAYLVQDLDCGLNDPATAAIALTVGGIAGEGQPAATDETDPESIFRPIATQGEPYPNTRVGPGLAASVKPEFVAPAGNTVLLGTGRLRRVDVEDGTSLMSLAHDWATRGSLFAFAHGTSFAAPSVARIAAMVAHRLTMTFAGDPVDPNTVRAVLAVSATLPAASQNLSERLGGEAEIRKVYGYGEIDEDYALDTGDRRTTLVAQGHMSLDSCLIYEIPTTEVFRAAKGKRSIIVSLGFDPPVRARRANYLGSRMSFDLVRGLTPEQIVECYRSVTDAERADAPGKPNDGTRCEFLSNDTATKTSTLQRRVWQFTNNPKQYADSYHLVITARREWAPADIKGQDFGLAVALVTEDETRLTASIRARLQVRARARSSG